LRTPTTHQTSFSAASRSTGFSRTPVSRTAPWSVTCTATAEPSTSGSFSSTTLIASASSSLLSGSGLATSSSLTTSCTPARHHALTVLHIQVQHRGIQAAIGAQRGPRLRRQLVVAPRLRSHDIRLRPPSVSLLRQVDNSVDVVQLCLPDGCRAGGRS